MTILQISPYSVGKVGVSPKLIPMVTNDIYSTITAVGWLNGESAAGVEDGSFIFVNYSNGSGGIASGEFVASLVSAGTFTLVPVEGGQQIVSVIGDFANFDTTTGSLTDLGYSPSNAAKTKVVMASAAVIANHIACFADTTGTVNDDSTTAINGGNLQAGLSGTAGAVSSFPATAAKGSLRLTGVANSGDTITDISNEAMGQASVVSIPDPGASTAKFLLNTGTNNILTDFNQFVSINEIILATVGTWTKTRIAEGNYVMRHTAADDTSILGIDITSIIRTAASKGFRLGGIDVIYSIGTLALDAHTLTLDRITYTNNAAVSVNSVTLTGSLATATQAQPYLTNITVATPGFLNTSASKYVLELTVNAAATSAYDFYGLNLGFSQTIA